MVCLQLHFEPHGGAVLFIAVVLNDLINWSQSLKGTPGNLCGDARHCLCACVRVNAYGGVAPDTRALQVNLSLGLNPGSLLLRPESLPMCRGVHAFSQCPLQLHDPLSCVPQGILGSQKRKLGHEDLRGGVWKQSSKKQEDECLFLNVQKIWCTHHLHSHCTVWLFAKIKILLAESEMTEKQILQLEKQTEHSRDTREIRRAERVSKCCDLCCHPCECDPAGVEWTVCVYMHSLCVALHTYGERKKTIRFHPGWWNCERKHWTEIINLWFSISTPFFFFSFSPAPKALTHFLVHTFTLFWERYRSFVDTWTRKQLPVILNASTHELINFTLNSRSDDVNYRITIKMNSYQTMSL